MKYDVFLCVLLINNCGVHSRPSTQCYKCQVMGVLACKCVHVREGTNPTMHREAGGVYANNFNSTRARAYRIFVITCCNWFRVQQISIGYVIEIAVGSLLL